MSGHYVTLVPVPNNSDDKLAIAAHEHGGPEGARGDAGQEAESVADSDSAAGDADLDLVSINNADNGELLLQRKTLLRCAERLVECAEVRRKKLANCWQRDAEHHLNNDDTPRASLEDVDAAYTPWQSVDENEMLTLLGCVSVGVESVAEALDEWAVSGQPVLYPSQSYLLSTTVGAALQRALGLADYLHNAQRSPDLHRQIHRDGDGIIQSHPFHGPRNTRWVPWLINRAKGGGTDIPLGLYLLATVIFQRTASLEMADALTTLLVRATPLEQASCRRGRLSVSERRQWIEDVERFERFLGIMPEVTGACYDRCAQSICQSRCSLSSLTSVAPSFPVPDVGSTTPSLRGGPKGMAKKRLRALKRLWPSWLPVIDDRTAQ